jgi:hypothetical protein
MSMLARAPGSRTTKDVDLASQQAPDLAEAERALADLVAVDHDTQIDTVTVDVAGPSPVGRPKVVEPANRLHLRRPLITPLPALPDTSYPGGKRSSRVKDLADLVVLAHTQTVDLAELRSAIAAKRVISGIEPFERFDIPIDWTRTYVPTSKGVPSAESFTAAAGRRSLRR